MKLLTRSDLKKIMGGDAPSYGVCRGRCHGSVGEWEYVPQHATFNQCLADIGTYCSSGQGYCLPDCSDNNDPIA